jgi:signal transduction histidine kinase
MDVEREVVGIDVDRAQLGLFIRANLVTVIGAVIGLLVISATIVRSGWLVLDAAAVASVVVSLLIARRWLDENRTGPALTLLAAANFVVAIVTTAITPFILPVTTLVVVLPVIVILPFLGRRRLLATSIGAIAAAVVLTVVAAAHLVDGPQEQAPSWLKEALVILFVPVVTGLILLNAWRSHLGLVMRSAELRRSRSRIVVAADRARSQIERDLHDGAQQRLTAVAIRLGLVQRLIERDPVRASALLGELDGELHETIAELRDLAHGIYPPLLGQRGLVEALAAAARRSPVSTTVVASDIGRYRADVETAIYFCCLEAMQNATKHAAATEIRVDLDGRKGALEFSVVDDGVGFDPAAVVPGTGLTHMADRLGAAGGHIAVRSSHGHGTTVHGRVEIDAVPGL